MTRLRQILELAATAATIIVCAALTWSLVFARGATVVRDPTRPVAARRPEPPLPTELLSLNGSATKGSRSAKVALIEFSDFQCPYCGTFARETLPTIDEKYVKTGKILVAFRQFPLEEIHKSALHAAEVAECAGGQDKFWLVHDQSFQHQQQLDDVSGPKGLADLGLDLAKFDSCLKTGTGQRLVQADEALGKTLSVTGTPTFFLGTVESGGRVKAVQRFSGALPVAQLMSMVDAVLDKVGAKGNGKADTKSGQ